MNDFENNPIMKQIDVDRNHIENLPMETDEGTKRTKDKFYRNAVEQRNSYIEEEIKKFEKYKDDLIVEMKNRVNYLMPDDKSVIYDEDLSEENKLFELLKLNSNIPDSFKLKLDYIISSINDNTSLEDLNAVLRKFVDRFKELGITLSIEDFKYTMFTEQYMDSLIKGSTDEQMKEVFENIYFRCPDIKLQLKMNLSYIVDCYKDKLSKYVISFKEKLFGEYGVDEKNVTDKYNTLRNNIIDKYTTKRNSIGTMIATDEYYNACVFLDGTKKIADYVDGAPARAKNYNAFAVSDDYNSLDEAAKSNYDSAIMDLYLTLMELKKYYNYEFILTDLLERYKNKDAAKTQYPSKKKEIEKEEKNRLSLYKEYMKANGVGLFARKNEVKIKDSMMKMNEQVKKLHSLYDELLDLEITNNLNALSESASIYDLFMTALTSFTFLERAFSNEEKFQENSLEENIDNYFKFIFNPNNDILRKINVFTDYNIVSIVSEKYKLLNLTVTEEMIDKDNIDSTLDSAKFINLIQNIEKSNISIHTIDVLCKMNEIIKDNTPEENDE